MKSGVVWLVFLVGGVARNFLRWGTLAAPAYAFVPFRDLLLCLITTSRFFIQVLAMLQHPNIIEYYENFLEVYTVEL